MRWASAEALLSVRELRTAFGTRQGPVEVVRGISFDLMRGETLGLVGESGSGKSVTALSVMRLLPSAARIVGGSIRLDDVDLLTLSGSRLRDVRGGRIAMVFQDSSTSLNPLLTVGKQITETLRTHAGLAGRQARNRAVALLEEVGVPEPERRLGQFPHQLSGGLRQRVAVAIAIAPNPSILIADEPTTALDVTIQAQLLELLARERDERGMALLLITHDLGIVAGMADRLCVMYAGRIVEEGSTDDLFANPRHPYTLGLLQSVPRIDGDLEERLPAIPGTPPHSAALPQGCAFRPRCTSAVERCGVEDPPLKPLEPRHLAACWVPERRAS